MRHALREAERSPYPEQHERDFIAAARMLMICGLVYHHLFEIPGSGHSPRLSLQGVTHFVPELFNTFFHMAFMTAVPVLSVISGFLFFRRARIDFPAQLKKRFFTVALPSWLWCAIWLAFAWVLYTTVTRDTGRFAWSDYGFADLSPMTVVNGIFGLTREPFAFQFWFVHDLLLTLLLTPVIWFLLQRMGWYLLPVAFGLWLLIQWPPLFFSGNVPVFFTLGAWLAMPRSPGLDGVLGRLQAWRWWLLLAFTLALFVRIMSHRFGALDPVLQGYQYLCLLRVLGVMTAGAMLYRLVLLRSPAIDLLCSYSGYAFFIFAAHFPLIALIQEQVPLIPGYATTPGMFLSWLLIPLLTIIVTIACARFLERHFLPAFLVLNGGRETQLWHKDPGTRAEDAPRPVKPVARAGGGL